MAKPKPRLEPGISEEVIGALRAHGKRRTYQKGQLIVTAGDDFEELFIIEEGKFSYSSIDRHGNASVYGYKEAGSMWGLAGALMRTPASFFFEAVEESVATCVSHDELWRLIDSDPIIRRGIIYRLGWAVFEATSFGSPIFCLRMRMNPGHWNCRNRFWRGILVFQDLRPVRSFKTSRNCHSLRLSMGACACSIETN